MRATIVYIPAATYLKQDVVAEMSRRYSDLRIERIANRADIAATLVAKALQSGELVQPKQLTAASLQCTFTENGVQCQSLRTLFGRRETLL
jgi:hypothetical protein